ncbi:MAG: DEAD/DEAH box helicase [Bacillales bacterium]|jgi:SNF2 family DNA or RNA helicase|nr:DEAD/DEAH box helicase [Bacillales bacterium]
MELLYSLKIFKEGVNENVFNEAKKLLDKVKINYVSPYYLQGEVDELYKVQINNSNREYFCNCNCYQGNCQHSVALLIKYKNDKIEEENIKKVTDKIFREKLSRLYEDISRNRYLSNTKIVSLLPLYLSSFQQLVIQYNADFEYYYLEFLNRLDFSIFFDNKSDSTFQTSLEKIFSFNYSDNFYLDFFARLIKASYDFKEHHYLFKGDFEYLDAVFYYLIQTNYKKNSLNVIIKNILYLSNTADISFVMGHLENVKNPYYIELVFDFFKETKAYDKVLNCLNVLNKANFQPFYNDNLIIKRILDFVNQPNLHNLLALDNEHSLKDDLLLAQTLFNKNYSASLNLEIYKLNNLIDMSFSDIISPELLVDNFDYYKENYFEMFKKFLFKEINNHSDKSLYSLKELLNAYALLGFVFDFSSFRNNDKKYYQLISSGLLTDSIIDFTNYHLPFVKRFNGKIGKALFKKWFLEIDKNYDVVRLFLEKKNGDLIVGVYNNGLLVSGNAYSNNDSWYYKADYKQIIEEEFYLENSYLKDSLEKNTIYDNYLQEYEPLRIAQKEKDSREKTEILFNDFYEIINSTKVLLSQKMEIEPELTFFEDSNVPSKIKSIGLRLKVGNSKMFIVKSIKEFLERVENQLEFSYGKTLSFNHTLENFSVTAQNIIKLVKIYFDNKYSDVRPAFLIDLYSLCPECHFHLVNSYVSYPYAFAREEIVAELIVDEKGLLKSSLAELKNVYFLNFDNVPFIVSKDLGKMIKINYLDDKSKKIHQFLLLNKDFNTQFIKEDFLNKVYPVIANKARVSEVFKKENPLKEFVIKAFFDYDDLNNTISLDTKYFIDDMEIKELRDLTQQAKLNQYQTILSSLGFMGNILHDNKSVFNFIRADLTPLKEIALVFVSENLAKMKAKSTSKWQSKITLKDGLISSHIYSAEFNEEELAQVIRALRRKKKYIFLKDKVIEVEGNRDLQLLDRYIKDFNISEKQVSKENISPIYNIFKLDNYSNENIELDVENKIKEILLEIKNYKKATIKIPENYLEVLRPYQKDGFKWLAILAKYHFGGILADDMGLGKTVQTLCLIDYLITDKPLIIVCPKSLIYNWEAEFKHFNTITPCEVIDGSKSYRNSLESKISNTNKKVYIVSYDTMRNDIDNFANIIFEYVILDEAQNIKNIKAEKTKTVKELNSLNKLVLTGTPIENAISDLWSIFDFLMKGYLYKHDEFLDIEKKAVEGEKEALNFIINKTKPFILRRTKAEVLKDLPPKVEEILYTHFKEESKGAYAKVLIETKENIVNNENSGMAILAGIMKLRQLCLSPAMLFENTEKEIEISEKLEVTLNLINDAILNGHKVLVFSSFVKGLNLLETLLQKNNILYFLLTGDTPAEKRLEMTNSFNDLKEEHQVFLISLKAGGIGLNLIGADIVIHLDPWWNVAAENQASDRAHRIGQTRSVHIYKIIIKDSIEERVIELQKVKKDLSDAIIKDDDAGVSRLSLEDYKFLLE